MPEFVEAVSKTSKQKQIIPAVWLTYGFAPFNDFTLPPSAKATAIHSPAQPVTKKEAK